MEMKTSVEVKVPIKSIDGKLSSEMVLEMDDYNDELSDGEVILVVKNPSDRGRKTHVIIDLDKLESSVRVLRNINRMKKVKENGNNY